MKTNLTFRDLYRFPGFRACATLKPHPEDPKGYIITLERRQKKRSVPAAGQRRSVIGIAARIGCGICMPEPVASILRSSIAGLPVRDVMP